MRDLLTWSLGLGRWGGVHVRLHVFFPLLAVFVINAGARDQLPPWYAATLLAALFAGVVLHEVVHCLTVRRLGGRVDQIVMWPLGGLAPSPLFHEPHAELLASAAGPFANFMASVTALAALMMNGQASMSLLNPLSPPETLPGFTARGCLELVFWLNWGLLLVNLLPAAPMDGGRLFRAAVSAALGTRSSGYIAARLAQATAVALWVAAWFVDEPPFAWAPLVLLGVLVFFTARQEALRHREHQEADDGPFGYDFSQGYTSLDRSLDQATKSKPKVGPLRRWLEERRAADRQRQQEQAAAEELQCDEILARLHERGINGLSSKERELLNRVSARYRDRRGQ